MKRLTKLPKPWNCWVDLTRVYKVHISTTRLAVPRGRTDLMANEKVHTVIVRYIVPNGSEYVSQDFKTMPEAEAAMEMIARFTNGDESPYR